MIRAAFLCRCCAFWGVVDIGEPSAPLRFHQEIVRQLHLQVGVALEVRRARTYVGPFDVCLPKDGEADEQIDIVLHPKVLRSWYYEP